VVLPMCCSRMLVVRVKPCLEHMFQTTIGTYA
jgi:hypothetical protein